MRSQPEVRPAERDDLVVVAALTAAARPTTTVGVPVDTAGEDAIRAHLSIYLATSGQVLVAELDGHIVGFVLTRTAGPYLFAEVVAWVVDSLYVTPDARRRGVGHALVAGVAALAGESGATYVYAGATAGDRNMQRFLARLGFAPAAGHRVVPTATLLRRLAQEGAPTVSRPRAKRDATRAALDDIIARRRRAREAGTHTAPIGLSHRRVS
ncbi:GNAT family N-acetyltransferase [Xylanimonas protaetiae]|uniref:GNAT family N-acetyltransferase n=1 Tax=Xylanimonas protaetiae TaxID=2509457 RepID=A0A4P6F4M3_9MICO|nr:GNAT family N-acetyltransferase [Xylanimonas protaetiae]QAY70880.1 GNAT family N-acetyltransferase [Xylanimonas protaetiae]